jgi:predicted nucleic acid-binding Zn ribbon protein
VDNENEKSKELTTSSDKFCVNCGAKVEQNQLYCSVCGNKVDTIAEKTKQDKKVLIIMGVVVGFLVIVICLNLFGGNNENETETTQVQQETEMEQ